MKRFIIRLLLGILLFLTLLLSSSGEVIELSESNFEHQTQASTGQTTGKWIILFAVTSAQDRVLEELASDNLPDGMIVAKVNAAENENVAVRLGVKFFPTFMLFADRRMYEYKGPNTVEGIKIFLEKRYKTLDGSKVPPPLSTIDIWKRAVEKKINEWVHFCNFLWKDLKHIGQYRKNAAVALVLLGIAVGVTIGFVTGILLGGQKTKKSKSD